jgi:hypothetical protein
VGFRGFCRVQFVFRDFWAVGGSGLFFEWSEGFLWWPDWLMGLHARPNRKIYKINDELITHPFSARKKRRARDSQATDLAKKEELSMGFLKLQVAMVLFLTLCCFVAADSINLTAGHPHFASLVSQMDTNNWAGIIVTQEMSMLSDSLEPFMTITMDTPMTYQIDFPGYNLNDGNHYYMATLIDNFEIENLRNATSGDLAAYRMFGSADFPGFYDINYNLAGDSPNKTFCCDQDSIEVGGVNFTAYTITLNTDVKYYLLKYGDGTGSPIFLSPIEDATCFDTTSCVSEFMIPISDTPYNFYAITKKGYYLYNITIDDVYTRTFAQTALPYKVWVRVINAISKLPAPNVSLVIGEDIGQNIFIPYRLDGYMSHAYSTGLTDDNGTEEFLIAPTVYPSIANYTIYVGAFQDGILGSQKELYISSKDSLIHVSKPISPNELYDNAKVSVNAMNQINNYLFRWSSQMLQARKYVIDYETTTHNFTVTQTGYVGQRNLTLKTGAPNVLQVSVLTGGVPQSGYMVRIKEQGGYLIMDPYTADSPFRSKTRVILQTVPTLTEFVVTPTSLGVTQSNITLEIIQTTGSVSVANKSARIESSLDMGAGGTYYNNDMMKTIVNAMNSVLYSLFYSLNN